MADLKRLFRKPNARVDVDWIVVGLGNGGPGYAGNRHNVGFQTINELAKRGKVRPMRLGSVLSAALIEIDGKTVALVKPLTMYNGSGKAVAQILQRTTGDIEHTIVVYDDLDMRSGALRIRQGGGHGGNNGMKSIGQHVGLDLIRIKIGIGRPVDASGEPTWESEYVADYVLSDPKGSEREALQQTVSLAADAVETIIRDGLDLAISRFNRK